MNRIEGLGCQVEHIPAGCTGMAQPVDVGINKPLKARIKEKANEYLLKQVCNCLPLKAPAQGLIACWVHCALDEFSPDIVRNYWTHGKLSYYACN